ncbi:MAG TPA: hypothetical protein VFM46_12485 [Pseudomonadales bacterium]|nr:hypothetical protein [Pseudomonadales bacterium]
MTDTNVNLNLTSIAKYGVFPGNSAASNSAGVILAQNSEGGFYWPEGIYALSAGVNLAKANVTHKAEGNVTLDFSAGTGLGFVLDAGGSGAIIKNCNWEGFYIKGGPSITSGFYLRGIVRSVFRKLEVKEATTAGFDLLFSVLNEFDHCIISDDTGLMTTRPVNYWRLNNDGTAGNHSQANTFINCEASGQGTGSTNTGWTLIDAILNTWLGGTSESLLIGIDIQNDICRENSWHGFDLEDNRQYDARIKGYNNGFVSLIAQSTLVTDNISISTGVGTYFAGGYVREVNLGASSSDTAFFNVTFDDNASLGIQGSGTFKRYNCITNTGGQSGNKTGTLRDVLGVTSAVTLVGSQNNTPAQTVTLNEAIVTGRMCYQRGKIAFTGAGTGGNSIAVTMDSTFPAKASEIGLPVGTFVYTTAGGTKYAGVCILSAATVLVFVVTSSTGNLGINPAITIANGDTLVFSADYQLE